jgi:hypothetical protein
VSNLAKRFEVQINEQENHWATHTVCDLQQTDPAKRILFAAGSHVQASKVCHLLNTLEQEWRDWLAAVMV